MGAIVVPARAVGYACSDLFGRSSQARQRSGRPLRSSLESDLRRIRVSAVRPGDVLLLGVYGNEHMALVTGVAPLTILHASPFPHPRVVEHALDRPMIPHVGQRWNEFVTAAYRFSLSGDQTLLRREMSG